MFKQRHSEESKEKMRAKKKGILPPQLAGYWTGRKQTEEHRQKSIKNLTHRYQKGQIAPMKGRPRPDISGDKCHFWKDGMSPIYFRIRREKLKQNGGSHTIGEWETLKIQYGYRCPMCQRLEPEIKLTKDHIIPISKGGSDFIENIQPLCKSCNSKKNNKLIGKVQVVNINLK